MARRGVLSGLDIFVTGGSAFLEAIRQVEGLALTQPGNHAAYQAMRFKITISTILSPVFAVFGFRKQSSWVELSDNDLNFNYGTAHERVLLDNVESVGHYDWPFYYGVGAKLGPDGSAAYVGSLDGVVQVKFKSPIPMNVWGPFNRKKARSVIVSLEDAQGFIAALEEKLQAKRQRRDAETQLN